MGILNVTPDSFSDGGRFVQPEHALQQALAMECDGADCIDLGAESTRPGATAVSAADEWERLAPVLKVLVPQLKIPLSVDTYKASVAESALQSGASVINDVWGLQRDPDMASVLARYDAGVVIMHNQEGTEYQGDIIGAITAFFHKSLTIADRAGISRPRIVLDPGIGFGKTPAQNLEVLRRLHEFKDCGYPLLLGVSRKSVIGHTLGLPPDQRIEGTITCNVAGIAAGVRILRVHDIQPNIRAARMADAVFREILNT